MVKPDFFQQADDYRKVEQVLQTFDTDMTSSPDLNRIAGMTGMSAAGINHLFKRWAGVSPTRFFNYLTQGCSKLKLLEEGRFTTPAATISIATDIPRRESANTSRLQIDYGFIPTHFGLCLLAVTGQAICYLGFVNNDDPSSVLAHLHHRYRGAELEQNQSAVEPIGHAVFNNDGNRKQHRFQLRLRGTAFQSDVWQGLLKIPPGHLVSYQDVADHIGRPRAVRAVAGAIANNPVAYLIPCHRVIAKSGKIHQYRWGAARKKAMIGYEGVKTPTLDNL